MREMTKKRVMVLLRLGTGNHALNICDFIMLDGPLSSLCTLSSFYIFFAYLPINLILSISKRLKQKQKYKLDDSLMMVIRCDHFLLKGKKLNTLSSEICVCSLR